MKPELTCLYGSPPSWEGMLNLCWGCRAIWRCAKKPKVVKKKRTCPRTKKKRDPVKGAEGAGNDRS
jgi:hypothetical protein